MPRGALLFLALSLVGIGVALGFFYIGVTGGRVFESPPPVFLRVILVVFGALFGAASVLALRHAILQIRVRRGEPVPVMLEARVFSDSEATSYEIHIRRGAEHWIAPAYGGAGIRRLLQDGPLEGLAWFDGASGLPLALEVAGAAITTYPQVRTASGEEGEL
ncbi:MAG: hypothetical protein AAGA15_00645 [Pseudomonadota bacterium]